MPNRTDRATLAGVLRPTVCFGTQSDPCFGRGPHTNLPHRRHIANPSYGRNLHSVSFLSAEKGEDESEFRWGDIRFFPGRWLVYIYIRGERGASDLWPDPWTFVMRKTASVSFTRAFTIPLYSITFRVRCRLCAALFDFVKFILVY